MKAILKFDLSDPEERTEHLRCVKSLDMACVLFEIQKNLKRHGALKGLDYEDEIYDYVLRSINDLMDQHGLDIDELIN